ncbi:MAG: GDP-mannose 4,6-dehydratase [Candidatus Omnitrophota bacterium]
MKILVLGITGFAGTSMYHFLKHIDDNNLYGTFRHSTGNRNITDNFSEATLFECDINDVYSIERALSTTQPDVIFHFASYVSVFDSLNNPIPTFQTNIIGTTNLMEGIRKIVPQAKILIPGSAEEYGKVPEDKMPIKETYPLNSINPYAISKKVQEEIGFYYLKNFGLNIYFTRTFHYTGPRQPLGFVCSDIVKQIVDVETGKKTCIKVGNLEAKRDFTDIRDVVSAYWRIINSGKAGEVYNVCTGKSIKIQEILNKLITFSGKDILLEIDKNKLRPSDVPDFVGDNIKLSSLGWIPQYTIENSLIDLLEWWRGRIRIN